MKIKQVYANSDKPNKTNENIRNKKRKKTIPPKGRENIEKKKRKSLHSEAMIGS